MSEVEASETRAGQRFNGDFLIEFEEKPFSASETEVAVAPVLPNSIGPAVDLLVEKATLKPLLLELMFGQSLGISYYKPFIELVESHVNSHSQLLTSLCPSQSRRAPRDASEELSTRLCIERSRYARVMIVGEDICFLVFPGETAPKILGTKHVLEDCRESAIDCYIERDRIVCFDGWIAVGDQDSQDEQRLVAVPADM